MKINLDHTQIIIQRTKKRIFRAVILIMVIILIIISLSGLTLANKNKLVRGLKIANVSVGGLTIEKALVKIGQAEQGFFEKEIILRHQDKIWTAKPQELGIKIDIGPTLVRASEIGHQKKFFSDLSQQILAFFGHYNLDLNYGINEIELENFIREKLNSIDNPAVDAGLKYDEESQKFVLIPSQKGEIVDRTNLKPQLYEKVEKLTKDDIYLNLVNDHPEILDKETKEAHIKAQEILENAPYTLTPTQTLLTKGGLIPLIEFKSVPDENDSKNRILGITLSEEGLKDYLITLSLSINRGPIDAQFKVEGSRVTSFRFSKDGLKLEIEKNISKLKEEILAGKKAVELEVSIIPPKIATKNIKNLGITSFLGMGVSNFAGSPSNRIHNIKVGAAKFHGVLIKPGEEFSFNTILGEVGPEQGYKAELVIKRTATVPEYGGGLCQVSTTTFRAAVNTGLPITERAPHAFPVVYYNPQGFDATIYPPHPDLRFINNTSGHILIQTKVEGNILTFEFYGTDDGRKIEIDGPHQYDLKSDGSMKAKLTRKVYKNNELFEEKTWYSNYKSPSLYPVQRNPLE